MTATPLPFPDTEAWRNRPGNWAVLLFVPRAARPIIHARLRNERGVSTIAQAAIEYLP
ncbi:MAG: hypothetical protein JJU11_10935 [Candidatus Sumerlaeia bacterium]|nr:hypothetical protein [Candidatus Sumerlaeia bacterium]